MTSTAQAYEWVKTGHWSLRQFREWFDALAKQEQGEPVGIVESAIQGAGGFHVKLTRHVMPMIGEILYTTPQQRTWVGLTNEEKADIAAQGHQRWKEYAEAIEAKLKAKNGP